MSTAEVIAAALAEIGVEYQERDAGQFLVTLPGTRRLRTHCWLIVREHALFVQAFVCRRPDEDHEVVYRFLLQRNATLRTVAYALDSSGDIHLVGRVSRAALTDEEVDTVLGVVLATSDQDFNAILERGFAGAIRREWAWRTSRGESVRNLKAFRHLLDP